jgi:hypothetical protein
VSRCRFPHLEHLDIELANLYEDPEGMPHICRFLEAHGNIRSLRILRASSEEHMSIIPFVRAQTLHIGCRPRCPPQSWTPLLRPEVKTLELGFSSFSSEREQLALKVTLWALLTQFAAEEDTHSTLEEIHLRSTRSYDDDGLTLTTVKGFLSTLRSHILPLKAHGIRVFVDDREICE